MIVSGMPIMPCILDVGSGLSHAWTDLVFCDIRQRRLRDCSTVEQGLALFREPEDYSSASNA